MSHTLVNLSSCKLYECVMSYVRMRLCQTHEWVMSHIWMSHVTYEWAMSHMKWSSKTHDCVISHVNEPYHTWMRPVTYEQISLLILPGIEVVRQIGFPSFFCCADTKSPNLCGTKYFLHYFEKSSGTDLLSVLFLSIGSLIHSGFTIILSTNE